VDDSTIQSSVIPPLPAILAGPRMTTTLYQGLTGVTHGSWNDAYVNGLAAGLPPAQQIRGWRVEVTVATKGTPRSTANVACLLPGRGAAMDSALVITAHYDHLGTGTPDEQGDSVYNGFFDNATGVAMALAVGQWFSAERPAGRGLRHSLILLFPSGEEQGLLGADYFTAHPSWPLARITALFNFDANAPPGPPVAWRVAGVEEGALVQAVVQGAARRGWTTTVAPAAPGSDYFPFLQRGVPAVFFVPGDGTYEGMSITLSDSLRTGLWTHYHQATDEYATNFGFSGLQRYADFTRDLLLRVDGGMPPGGGSYAGR
jgi:Zn-dependent M28 family amino/carboxypeptidase